MAGGIVTAEDDALIAARHLIDHGVPVFLASPAMVAGRWDPTGGHGDTGYWMPPEWQRTVPDVAVLDRWRQGDALCAVMGHGVDLLDVDPRNGGDASASGLRAAGIWPRSYGAATTPSGGTHDYVRSLGVGSRDGVRPGLDVKAGTTGGTDHGFAFLPPTIRASKVNGDLVPYAWTALPNLDGLGEGDDSGAGLAELVTTSGAKVNTSTSTSTSDDDVFADPFGPKFELPDRIAAGTRDGVLFRYASSMQGKGVPYAEALLLMEHFAFPRAVQPPGEQFTLTAALAKVHAAYDKYGDASVAAPTVQDVFDRAVAEQVQKLQVIDAARERVKVLREEAEPLPELDLGTLASVLARPDRPEPWRVVDLVPSSSSMVLVGPRKIGKSSAANAYARALLTGEPFLGTFTVDRTVTGRIALLNYELPAATAARWASEAGIDPDRFVIVSLRGQTNPLATERGRLRLAKHLRDYETEAVVVDPYANAYTGEEQNSPSEATRFLAMLSEFTRTQVGATDLVVTAHAGWKGEHARGASTLEDWADVILTMTKGTDDMRYMSALGRDVDVDKGRLDYDHATRSLTFVNGASTQARVTLAKLDGLAPVIVQAVKAEPGIATGPLVSAVRRLYGTGAGSDPVIKQAIKQTVQRGSIRVEGGNPGTAQRHYLTPVAGAVLAGPQISGVSGTPDIWGSGLQPPETQGFVEPSTTPDNPRQSSEQTQAPPFIGEPGVEGHRRGSKPGVESGPGIVEVAVENLANLLGATLDLDHNQDAA